MSPSFMSEIPKDSLPVDLNFVNSSISITLCRFLISSRIIWVLVVLLTTPRIPLFSTSFNSATLLATRSFIFSILSMSSCSFVTSGVPVGVTFFKGVGVVVIAYEEVVAENNNIKIMTNSFFIRIPPY